MTPVPSSPVALLDQLDELRAKADIVPLRQTLGDLYTDRGGRKVATGPNGMMLLGHDAALIVAAVNAVGPLTAAVRAVLELADELDGGPACDGDVDACNWDVADRIRAALSVTP